MAEAIRQVTGLNAVIKWPNDIIFHGKKLCGILTEMSTEIGCINYVVIGVGINVNQETFPEEIKDKATSLRLETGGRLRRAELIAAVMEQFESCYGTFLKTKDLSGVRERYNRLLVNRNQEVKVIEPGNEYEAYAIGINDTGELLVRTKDGERAIFAGEVSVRGVYGYV